MLHSSAEAASRRYGFYSLVLLWLLAGVSGAFLTGDIFNLYVWFEVMLISSFGLIIIGSERKIQLDGAIEIRLPQPHRDDAVSLAHSAISTALFGTLNMADIVAQGGGRRNRSARS